jgi:hypothetical protein
MSLMKDYSIGIFFVVCGFIFSFMGYIYICEFGYLMRPFAIELLQFKIPFEKYNSKFTLYK